jgi:hypothetical protein
LTPTGFVKRLTLADRFLTTLAYLLLFAFEMGLAELLHGRRTSG